MDGLHLELLARAAGARRAVEIGTLGGYSGVCLLRGMPDGRLDTFELEPRNAAVARESFEKAGVAGRARIHVGPAVDKLREIEADGPFDLVFIDADKTGYPAYLTWAEEHLRVGGIVLLDNAFGWGGVADPAEGGRIPTPSRARQVRRAARRRRRPLARDHDPDGRRARLRRQGAVMLGRLADPLRVRWIVLRGLGVLYLSVFWSLAGQIHGLIGPHGILPATDYLATLRAELTLPARLWMAPSLLWLSASDGALTALVVVGTIASLALVANLWPRASLAVARGGVPLVRRRRPGVRLLPVGRHADGGVVPRHLLRAARAASRASARRRRRRAPRCGCCAGSGSASTSSRAWSS